MTDEFIHYEGCNQNDPNHCTACALTTGGGEGPNHCAWPLAYIENKRPIPAEWIHALLEVLEGDNKPYADNIRRKAKELAAQTK